MDSHENTHAETLRRAPWNRGKLIGPKPPLRPKHVWSVRTKLQMDGRMRDLAMFNLAIDSKLRGCDVVALKVEDVAPNGYAVDRATVRQRKTGQPVRFELTEQTRQAIDDYVRVCGKKPGEFLFTGLRRVEPTERVQFRSGREIDDVLHLGHHRYLVGPIRQMNALSRRAHVVAVEIGRALLELREILDRSQ